MSRYLSKSKLKTIFDFQIGDPKAPGSRFLWAGWLGTALRSAAVPFEDGARDKIAAPPNDWDTCGQARLRQGHGRDVQGSNISAGF
ncbi:hypothetical protein E4U21_003852 [Claviceps maximensis]|nr:hypothetical protein E4U21_003852 [Claviceps maximensis]